MEAHAGEKRARDELPVTMGQVVVVEDDVKPVVKRPRIQTEDLYDPWMPTDETVVEEQAEPSEPATGQRLGTVLAMKRLLSPFVLLIALGA